MARIAFIVDNDFEDMEFRVPYDRLRAEGHEVAIVGHQAGQKLTGKKHKETIETERAIEQLHADDWDALVIPGGYSPDHLRTNLKMVGFVREMFNANKPIAAICHAGWMLVEADVAEGRMVTSWPSIRTDLINAGARWVDREVVEDGNLITSRRPADLDAFVSAISRQLQHGVSERVPRQGEVPQPQVH
jgi:protease I